MIFLIISNVKIVSTIVSQLTLRKRLPFVLTSYREIESKCINKSKGMIKITLSRFYENTSFTKSLL